MPPSLHPCGNIYEWEVSSRPESTELAPIPEWLINLASGSNGNGNNLNVQDQAKVDICKILEGIVEGQRDQEIFKYACRLRAKNMLYDEALCLVKYAAEQCKPPFPEDEAIRKLIQAWKYKPGADALPKDDETFETFATNETNETSETTCNKLETNYETLMKQTPGQPTEPKIDFNPEPSDNAMQIVKSWLETVDGNFSIKDLEHDLQIYRARADIKTKTKTLSTIRVIS